MDKRESNSGVSQKSLWAVFLPVAGILLFPSGEGWAQARPEKVHREWVDEAKLAGSPSCEKCHPEHQQRWHDSVHSKMVQIPDSESVLGDFTRDNTVTWEGHRYKMYIEDGKYYMTVNYPDGETIDYPVDYTIGSNRIQGYMSRLPDGRVYILPAYWHIPSRQWFDSSLITPHTPEGVGVRQYWNSNCLSCHATNLRYDYDPETDEYTTEYLEVGIGCEACHNPGSIHNEFFEKKPLRDYERTDLNDTYISNQRFFDWVRNAELCAYCHGTKMNYFPDYWPGDDAYDYFVPTLLTVGAPDQQGEYYPDGRPTRFNHTLDFMGSRCFLEGKATCISCHDGHSSENRSLLLVPMEESNILCLNCHEEKYGGDKLTEHTFHLPDSPGSRCYECHMGDSLERVVMHRRDHSLDNPIPENSIRFGVPNSCNENCHIDKTPEWSIRVLNQWYGDENRKKITYASQAMYQAKAGNPEAIPDLVRAMKDENLRMILRASAVSFLGKHLGAHSKSVVPEVIELLKDEHPLIRLIAAEALGRIGDKRAIGPVSQLLKDPYRTVRITAVSAMINMGVIYGKGEMGEHFDAAKGEYLASLQSWPNVPEFRLNVGILHFIDKKFDDAAREFQYALKINPEYEEAMHFLGLTYARLDQWKEALDAWEKLKDTNPEYEDVDQLISTAKERSKDR